MCSIFLSHLKIPSTHWLVSFSSSYPDGGQKKEQKKQSGGSKSKNAEVDVTVAKLDIRVGLIRKAQKHPDADSLYVEEIDVGEEAPRTVVSGLVKFIPLEEMQVNIFNIVCSHNIDMVIWLLEFHLFFIYDKFSEPESVCSLQSETSGDARYKITCNGSGCIK
jgi:tRNA-binding EMAP/Myf-like protein